MIYNEYMQERVQKYCESIGIDVKRPLREPEKIRMIQDFIRYQVRIDKNANREKLEENRMRIGCEAILAKAESEIEKVLYRGLIDSGLDVYFTPQYEEPPYTMDFACHDLMLGIECDGKEFHHANQEQIDRDKRRDKFLGTKGWTLIRIEGVAICRSLPYCIDKIKKIVKKREEDIRLFV